MVAIVFEFLRVYFGTELVRHRLIELQPVLVINQNLQLNQLWETYKIEIRGCVIFI